MLSDGWGLALPWCSWRYNVRGEGGPTVLIEVDMLSDGVGARAGVGVGESVLETQVHLSFDATLKARTPGPSTAL